MEAIDFRTQRVLRLVVGKLQDGRAALSAPGVERPLIFGPVHFSIHGKNIFISAPGISEPNSSLRIRGTGVGQMGGGYIQGTVTIKLPAPRGAADVWNNVTLAMLPGGAVFAVYDEAKKAAEALSNDARAAEHGVAPDERAPAAPARR